MRRSVAGDVGSGAPFTFPYPLETERVEMVDMDGRAVEIRDGRGVVFGVGWDLIFGR